MHYDHKAIEKKWQTYWQTQSTFKTQDPSEQPKCYVLDMFPYPSGAGLHVGHPLGYIASDIYARYKRHKGFNVLHPMGFDSFGLPAEQYAIETGQEPEKTTRENINRYTEQLHKLGFSFDWSRKIETSSPDYYKWTQWIFLQLFDSWFCNNEKKAKPISELKALFATSGNQTVNAACDEDTARFSAQEWNAFNEANQEAILSKYRLTYLAETNVNWCPNLGTVLANDEVVNGLSERGGHPVYKKKMKQWMMRITAYAERLLQEIDPLEWSEAIKETQRNWIGKSLGAQLFFEVEHNQGSIEVFTTRPDTIFGVTFLTLAPEHPLVKEITTQQQKSSVECYVLETSKKSERERSADMSISGVFTGAYAIHPFTKQKLPIWISDYVLMSYATGAVMAVPAGDSRDHKFAKHCNIPIIDIFKDVDVSEKAFDQKENITFQNSDFLNGLNYKDALNTILSKLEERSIGKRKTNYKLRDAVFSRQRYWGEPVPIYYENGIPKAMDEHTLPLELPKVDKYLPTPDGHPPLANSNTWNWNGNRVVENGTGKPIELNTMPGWAGSSWYMLRYMDPHNDEQLVSEDAEQYWQQVDMYVGGSEHATGHLVYSRFWHKFLNDRGCITTQEPFKKMVNQGMILGQSALILRDTKTKHYISKGLYKGQDVQKIHVNISLVNAQNELDIEQLKQWRTDYEAATFETEANGQFIVEREVDKMSKSKYNVINPDDICTEYGADTLRLYEMFLGPIDQAKPWSTEGIIGCYNFLKKLWNLYYDNETLKVTNEPASKKSLKTLHKLIKKVCVDIESFSFNTSVSTFMIATNELNAEQCKSKEILEPLLILLSPFCPHISEELWQILGHSQTITYETFPIYDDNLVQDDEKEYPVSVNGKKKFTLTLPLNLSKEGIETKVLADDKTKKILENHELQKMIVVPGKIINLVVLPKT